jgi:DNA-binding NarL/FixJ family response regulator
MRQREVLQALASASSFHQAAVRLGLSVRGVRSHATRIYRRLKAGSLEEALLAHAGTGGG